MEYMSKQIKQIISRLEGAVFLAREAENIKVPIIQFCPPDKIKIALKQANEVPQEYRDITFNKNFDYLSNYLTQNQIN